MNTGRSRNIDRYRDDRYDNDRDTDRVIDTGIGIYRDRGE